jgi:hypothetical protein
MTGHKKLKPAIIGKIRLILSDGTKRRFMFLLPTNSINPYLLNPLLLMKES